MSKKILISILLGVTLSFATWGYFPLKESNDGLQLKVSHFIEFGDTDLQDLSLDARYVYNHFLEVALMNVGGAFTGDITGLNDPLLEVRLQLSPRFLVFGEMTIPIGDDGFYAYYHVGIQKALVLSKHFAWSSEVGYVNYFTKDLDDREIDKASCVNVDMEFDVNFTPSFIIFAGPRFVVNVSESEYKDDYWGSNSLYDAGDFYQDLFAGFNLKITKNLYLEEEFEMRLLGIDTFDVSFTSFTTSLKYSF